MPTFMIPLDALDAHPRNSNAMPPAMFVKLLANLRDTGRYPPIIVRPAARGRYQILDGHHRVAALRELGESAARCDVWEVGDDQALVLLATLNPLEGRDDPRKRAALVAELAERFDRRELTHRLPEDGVKLDRLLALGQRPPAPAPPQRLEDMPVSLHFFLLPAQKRAVERRLDAIGPTREAALLQLIGHTPEPRP